MVEAEAPESGFWTLVGEAILSRDFDAGTGALAGLSGSACAKARAATIPESPPLAMPPPPPRVLAPLEEEPLASQPAGPGSLIPQPPTIVPRASTGTTRSREAPAPAAAATAPPAPVAPVENPGRQLTLATSPGEAAADQVKVRQHLERAEKDLKQVGNQRLSKEMQQMVDDSRSFAKRATEALNDRNLPMALALAEKAAQLAAEVLSKK